MRISIALVGVIALLFVAGCTKSDTGDADVPSGDTTPSTPGGADVVAEPADTGDAGEGDAAGAAKPDAAQPKMPGSEPDAGVAAKADAGAKKEADDSQTYPFLALLEAAGNDQLTQAYKDCEETLKGDPSVPEQRMQKAFVLFNAGGLMMEAEKKDEARKAFDAALEVSQALVKDNPELPPPYHRVLSVIYYNGACGEALAGNAEDAKALLAEAEKFGWDDYNQIKEDSDLASVRALPGFEAELDKKIEAARKAAIDAALEELAKGESFPFDFTVTDITGKEIKLADLKGKVAIVDIWGTWCPPCREEIPSFIKLQDQFGDKGFQMLGLNYENAPDDEAKTKLVKDYVDGAGINYPCALGSDEIQAQVPDFQGFPTTIFIDRTGKVRLKVVGLHEFIMLEAIVKTLLDEEVPEAPEVEEPKKEEPKKEEPEAEAPKEESVEKVAPEPDGAKTEAAKTEDPKVEDSMTEAPKVEDPKVEAPKTEDPKVEEPKKETPKKEEPKK